jgi:hypothetical protein
MLVSAALSGGLSGGQLVQLIAVLLGLLVFAAIVLVVERRNAHHEAVPPGRTALEVPLRSPVRRAPAGAVPIASARVASDTVAPANPYPVPFVADPPTEEPAE